MDAVLNPGRSTTVRAVEMAEQIIPRKTETVPVTEIRPGDTVIDYNLHRVPFYRVVSRSEEDPYNEGFWSLEFDRDRDVPGPGQDFLGTITHNNRKGYTKAVFERVTDLGDWEMADVASLRELDKLADGRGVREVARQVSADKQILVRFASSDNFTKVRPGTIVLVEGRRVNKHVEGAMNKAHKQWPFEGRSF